MVLPDCVYGVGFICFNTNLGQEVQNLKNCFNYKSGWGLCCFHSRKTMTGDVRQGAQLKSYKQPNTEFCLIVFGRFVCWPCHFFSEKHMGENRGTDLTLQFWKLSISVFAVLEKATHARDYSKGPGSEPRGESMESGNLFDIICKPPVAQRGGGIYGRPSPDGHTDQRN